MSLEIDPHSPVPSHRQLADALRARIVAGEYRPRQAIPSLTQLQQETGLSKGTVMHALSTLAAEGLIYRVPGRGTFVSENKLCQPQCQPTSGSR